MTDESLSGLMYKVVALKQELASRSAVLLGAEPVAFQEITVKHPRLESPELGFHQAVSWLYCFYYEAGRVSLTFLLGRFQVFGLDDDGMCQTHFEHIRSLRTYLQHNLDRSSLASSRVLRRCEEWFTSGCGSAIPGNDQEWTTCLVRVLAGTQRLLEAAIDCVREIERDEGCTTIVEEWSSRLRGYHPRSEFIRMVEMVANDMGQSGLNAARICDRYYDKWSKDLSLRTSGFDFETEARKLIEHTLLSEARLPLPITGQDLIRGLGIPPGPEIGKLLRTARILYDTNPCSKDELLSRLTAGDNSEMEGG